MNKRTTVALAATATAAVLALGACSSAPSAVPADTAKVCAAISGAHGDASTDPVALALAGGASRASIAYDSATGEGAPASLVSLGCTLIVGADSTMASAISEAARANPRTRFALVGASFVDAKGHATTLKNGSVVDVDASQAAYLAGYAAAGMTTTGTLGVVGGARDNVTSSQMSAFSQGVDAYNLANGTSISVLGWNTATNDGTYAQDAEQVRAATSDFITRGADIILPLAGAANQGAARAVTEAANPLVRLVWSGLTREDLKGLTRDEAQSAGDVPMSGQSGAAPQQVADTQSFADAFSYIQISDEVRASIGAPVLTGIVVDYSSAADTLISDASAGGPSSTVPVSLVSGGVILTGFGSYTPMLSADLKLGLSDMAGQIESGGLMVSTPFDA
ncbi:BMP family ABC transporter substrate-binding protein [Cellulomonas flavigena]|uniref:BMP family ABC transporter substrate-binding protein n=1 Tax=Cellulomonas flavigena TaxID=1711 RepID=UPI0006606DBF|nr:BMP family ABC transporter substrate-binding protein [Cellulomonas flavigena]